MDVHASFSTSQDAPKPPEYCSFRRERGGEKNQLDNLCLLSALI